eukprot:10718589-Alexandrium_andersonii.AAC.1
MVRRVCRCRDGARRHCPGAHRARVLCRRRGPEHPSAGGACAAGRGPQCLAGRRYPSACRRQGHLRWRSVPRGWTGARRARACRLHPCLSAADAGP